MRVLILNQTFYPDTAATAQLMWDVARRLDDAGHRVSVVTSRVYYGTDRVHEHAVERFGRAIDVRRVSGTRFGKGSRLGLAGRASDFASFYLAAGRELWAGETPDVVLALTSPPMVAALAVALKAHRQALGAPAPRVVYHVMDLYPDAAEAAGALKPGGLAARVMAWLTALTLRRADATIALGRDMKERLLARYAAADSPAERAALAGRIHVVPPWADDVQLRPLAKRDNPLAASLGLLDTFTVVYSGNLGVAHDVATLVQAIELTRRHRRFCWLFIGGGSAFERLRAEAARRGWPHFRALPFFPRAELNASLNLADVHLVSQLPAFTGVVVPSKLFGAMAVGRPTVMVGPADAECSRVLREHDAGLVVANGDAAGLVRALERLRDDPTSRERMGRHARAAVEAHYGAGIATSRVEEILRTAVETGSARRGTRDPRVEIGEARDLHIRGM
jgi:colanic acid biosynthesis glycosyl transferase WcaI